MKIYLDTCVYIDYFEDRSDNIRPLGELVFQLLNRTFNCEFDIIVSDWVVSEIAKQKDMLHLLLNLTTKLKKMNKLIMVSRTEKLEKEALLISKDGVHFQDALHIVLAAEAGAEYIVTRNLTDFPAQYGSTKTVLPENI